MGAVIDMDLILSNLYYDETSPSCLRWLKVVGHGRMRAGSVAGGMDTKGYWIISLRGKRYKAHRIVWCMFSGECIMGKDIDHIDGNPSNNKFTNLRIANRMVNRLNTSKGSGARFTGRRYKSSIKIDGKSYTIGFFDTKLEAELAYREKKAEIIQMAISGKPIQIQ